MSTTPNTQYRLIITIAVYGPENFVVTQNEMKFNSVSELDRAREHYTSDLFRMNIEGAGAFVKVDAFQV